jgi:rare lipoprotein A
VRRPPTRAGRTITLERRGATGWKSIDKARTSASGRFALSFRARSVDTAQVRIRFAGDGLAKAKQRRVGRLNVFRPALASWYGPGLFGNALGCGGRLSTGTIGVAHKSLPCGTRLVLRKGSRIVRARVIDRGPYVGAREFDLTQATKRRLGFGSTGTVLVAH